MGYSLESGSVSSIMLGMIISITISIILITKKYKIFLLDNFKNILNIIYENIILCVILELFTLVVKIDTTSVISSILTIVNPFFNNFIKRSIFINKIQVRVVKHSSSNLFSHFSFIVIFYIFITTIYYIIKKIILPKKIK